MQFRLLSLLLCSVLLAGCSTKMEAENAQNIKLEVKTGTGKVSGILKAATPGMAGISSKNFDFTAPGSFEVMGGPSEYSITFDSLTPEMMTGYTVSIDGRELKRGPDMVVEDDKGPRLSFTVGAKQPEEKKE